MKKAVTALTVVVALLLGASVASADRIDERARQLRTGDYKVRLSAALWLSRRSDARAVAALAGALERDRRSTIREVAARALEKRVKRGIDSWALDKALAALGKARRDRDRTVRRVSTRAHDKLMALREPAAPRLSRVFVAIQDATDRTRRMGRGDLRAVQARLRAALRRGAPAYRNATRAEGLPTRADLARSLSAGFYVQATVSWVDARRKRGGVEVACAVDIRVGSWDGADQALRLRAGEFASASGRGRVTGGSSRAAVSASARDCVLAVVDSVTAKQVVPFLKRQAGRRLASATPSTTPFRTLEARSSRRRTRGR